ncbi:MAG: Holliday junction branch migration protein RuvA [Paracoccaceae bacterium]|nr:Holliday junction branch migration protein RuvA [Paracoccaceae bacterium]
MIGKLSGVIDYQADDHVLLDVRGVGYIIFCSDRTLAALPGSGSAVALYTDLIVREDLLQLFGFTTLREKEWHRLLTSIQGVGAKASLAILSTLGTEGVSRAIALGDWNAVKAARGIGPKTAQRVVNELKDKAPKAMAMGGLLDRALGAQLVRAGAAGEDILIEPSARPVAPPTVAENNRASAESDALSALSNLGYSPGDAVGAIVEATGSMPDVKTSDLIRAALKLLAPKG